MSAPKVIINKNIRNFADLAKVNRILEDAFAQQLAEVAADFMQSYITDAIYLDNVLKGESDNTNSYERTGDLLEAVVCRKMSNGQWQVGIDGRRIRNIPRIYTELWGQHTSVDNEPQARNIAEWIDEGNNSPLYEYEGIHYIEATNAYIQKIAPTLWNQFCKSIP